MEGYKLSDRLSVVAAWMKENKHRVIADIGTDHGYLAIYLALNNIADKVIAMDVRKSPLAKAEANVRAYRVGRKVDIRLSDGLEKLGHCEADAIAICGMGGRLIQRIMSQGEASYDDSVVFYVSPQSEIYEFRQYLSDKGFHIIRETFLAEDNQYYPIIMCRRLGPGEIKGDEEELSEPTRQLYLRYGKDNLLSGNEALRRYLEKEYATAKSVFNKVNGVNEARSRELMQDMNCIAEALKVYWGGNVDDEIEPDSAREAEGL